MVLIFNVTHLMHIKGHANGCQVHNNKGRANSIIIIIIIIGVNSFTTNKHLYLKQEIGSRDINGVTV